MGDDSSTYVEAVRLIHVTETILDASETEIRRIAALSRGQINEPFLVLCIGEDLEAMARCCGSDEEIAGSYMDFYHTLDQIPVARFSMSIPNAWQYIVGKWGATDGKWADWQRFVAYLEAYPDHILAGAWYAASVGRPTIAQTLRLFPPAV